MIDLIPDPILPPLPDAEYQALRDSIEEIGVQVPLLITSEGRIVDGHERHRACLELGVHRYPMRVLGGMTEAERRERAIRINAEHRHLTRQQRRELLELLIRGDPPARPVTWPTCCGWHPARWPGQGRPGGRWVI